MIEQDKDTGRTEGAGDADERDWEDRQQRTNAKRIGKRIAIGALAAAVVTFGAIWGVGRWNYSRTHASTDDAFVTGNLINVSPRIAGTLSVLTVEEGDSVQKGQLIARLDDSSEQATLRQASAALDAARSQVPQAQISLAYQQQATEAGIRKAQAAISAQSARTTGARRQVSLSAGTTQGQIHQAGSQVHAAEAQSLQADAQVQTARSSLEVARQAVETAQRAASAATARIQASQAEVNRLSVDEKRFATLLHENAVSRQQYDVVAASLDKARAQLTSDREQAAQAQSQVEGARAAVTQAQAQYRAAQQAAVAARQQVKVARAAYDISLSNRAQVGIQESNLVSNADQTAQARADLANALAQRQQVALRKKQILTVQAQARQAAAALANARVAEGHTYIYAPASGAVVRKAGNIGQSLSPGQSIVMLSQGNRLWVTANYKETQLTDVRVGQNVELEVDAFPGRIFRGHVQSINAATGAATSLLPPENATGNFTKVVQRIPVRIALDAAGPNDDRRFARADELARLRQGMSVTATIETGAKKD